MPIATISSRRLYQQVADQLLTLIDSGEFAVGTRLPTERELAVKLGVSRPTVREALIALEVHGRVRIRVGSGIYVLPKASVAALPTPVTQTIGTFAVLDARALIEGAIAEQAAVKATAADIAALDAILAAVDPTFGSIPNMLALDRQFHVTVAETLDNDAIMYVVGELFDQRMTPYFAQLASYFENRVTWRTAWDEHRAVRDAIAAGDGLGARNAMCNHLARSKQRFTLAFTPIAEQAHPLTAPERSLTPRQLVAGPSL